MKNKEYINEKLESSTVDAEEFSDELAPDKEIADESLLNSEPSLLDENDGEVLRDALTLYDEDEVEAPGDEAAPLDENENASDISLNEPTLFDENESEILTDEAPLHYGEDADMPGEDIPDESDVSDDADADGDEISDEEVIGDAGDKNDEEALPSADENKNEEGEEKPRRVDNLFDFIELFVFTLAAVFIITSFFFRYSIVDGGSMQNTLQDDEGLILRSIFYTPECGDIVVVQDKSTALKDPIVKRVIALGGQTVRFTRDAVYVDGVKLDEPYVYTADYDNPFGGEDIYRYSVYPSDALLPIVTDREDGVFYEITVPEGEIFVMGDHRNLSKDSRDVGTVHEDAVIGKVVLRFLPFNKFGKIE